jgi:uncharacterized protein (DUF2141 family)
MMMIKSAPLPKFPSLRKERGAKGAVVIEKGSVGKRMAQNSQTPSSFRGRKFLAGVAAFLALGASVAAPAAAQYRVPITNNPAACHVGSGPALMVTVSGIRSATGKLRVQSYRATSEDWLQKGRWINRIEVTPRVGTMTFCMPVPAAGSYAIAVRHDVDGNGGTNIRTDGGGMSNNPSITIFNLGKPSHRQTAVSVGSDVKSIAIVMKYM